MTLLQKNTLIVTLMLAYAVLWFNAPEIAMALTLAGGAVGYSCFFATRTSVDYELGQPVEQEIENR